ncbi:MAG: hypothetical protein GX825_06050 [Syntrophomonadaceae bacterium]|nr:hypothetical protein [Syntrophomonadaceae bacterium]
MKKNHQAKVLIIFIPVLQLFAVSEVTGAENTVQKHYFIKSSAKVQINAIYLSLGLFTLAASEVKK